MPTSPGRHVPTHRLRPNEKVWTPPHVIVLDTESQWTEQGPDEIHTMRCWVAVRVDRRNQRKTQPAAWWDWGTTPDSLAAWITRATKGRECCWLYAHNLNFDLAITALPLVLKDHGWTVTDFSVRDGAPWMRLNRGGRTLTVVDSWSWLPESLESLSAKCGLAKTALPDNAGTMDEWWQRCATDVDLTSRHVLALMDWWDSEELGRWTISGAGCGWNAMRHIDSHVRHVIQLAPTDEELPRQARWVTEALERGDTAPYVTQDRLAIRGGRRDAQVVRKATGGPWVELDLERAYTAVCRELPLPIRRGWTFDSLPVDSEWITSRFWGPIAECTIATDRPHYPVRHKGVTWWPVGTFQTVLAGPEMAWARANGHLVGIGPGQVHQLGLALRPWATWVLDPSRGGTVECPPVAQVACRAWGRSVVGKFAAHAASSERLEGPTAEGWAVTECWDHRTGRRGAEVALSGSKWLVTYDTEPENAYPAVLAWVESEVRVRLSRLLEALTSSWWTADTDGLLVDLEHALDLLGLGKYHLGTHARDTFGLAQAVCDWAAPIVAPLVLRPKKVFESLAVLGPQHLTAGDERRYSGVNRHAVEVEPGRFTSRDWPKLTWQMDHAEPGQYIRPTRTVTMREPTVHRWVLADGSTLPVRFEIDQAGNNRLVPWSESYGTGDAPLLAEVQYRGLRRVS